MSEERNHPVELDRAVRTRRERRARWEEEGERSIAQNLALIGSLGWAIVSPTLVGIFAGHWLDHKLGTGIFWTGTLLVLGVVAGCAVAWKRIQRG